MVVFEYASDSYSEEKFFKCGGAVAVVLNYNKRGFISKAVVSAFEQDWPCYEIIAIDDHSTDGSDDEMFHEVEKQCREKRIKSIRVVVIKNETNQTTLRQWRKVV